MKFEQVCQSINAFFAQNPIIRVMLPLSVPLMFVCVALQVLGNFISLGSVMSALSYIGFLFMLILALSECKFKMASIGLAIYAATYVYSLLRSIFKYHTVNWVSVIYLLLFGYFAFQSYRKSLQINK